VTRRWQEARVYFLAFSLSGPVSSLYREIGQPRPHYSERPIGSINSRSKVA